MSRLTKEQLQARYEAYLEASGHLRLDWTDDETERLEGNKVADRLERQAVRCLAQKSAVQSTESQQEPKGGTQGGQNAVDSK